MLRFYYEVALTSFRRQLVYRWANIAGLLTNIFFGMIFSYVIIALYRARPTVAGYDVQDTLRYTWLAQSLLMVVIPFNWTDLMQTIRSGDVVSDLSKPCDFYWYWFSREMGRNVYYLLFRAVPIYLAGMLIFQFGIPLQWQNWLLFTFSLPLGAMLGVVYRVLYNIAAFWLIEARALVTFAVVIAQFCTGMYVPVPLFPAWLRTFVTVLPFNSLMNLPTEILLGKLVDDNLWLALGRQVFWLVALTLVVRMITALASQRVVAQGG